MLTDADKEHLEQVKRWMQYKIDDFCFEDMKPLLSIISRQSKALAEVQEFAEQGNIENYNHLEEKIEKIMNGGVE